MWRRIMADGGEWEVRALASEAEISGGDLARDDEVLEFRCLDGLRPPRRVAVPTGSLPGLSDAELEAAYRRSRPIGGDHYGRPGKRMGDVTR